MNYFILTGKTPPYSDSFLKATEAIRNNGHKIVDDPAEADVIVAELKNITSFQILSSSGYIPFTQYSGWDNWLVREFF